jgi:transcriptional regulator with XRE-family HTH domain
MTFGERLRELREAAGMTQEFLARRGGVNIWTIRGYEQGRRDPNWKMAFVLADALGVSVEAFRDCQESTPATQPPTRGKAAQPAPGPPRRRGRPPRAKTAGAQAERPRGRPRKGG